MPDVIRLSMYQAAAMCGCFLLESIMNPGCYNTASGYGDAGYGLGMWTDYPYPYNNKLWAGEEMRSWVSSRYNEWYSGEGQVACVIADDLNIKGKYNDRIHGSMWTDTYIPEFLWSNAQYPNFQTWLNDTNNRNLERLTQAWFLHWESPTASKWYYNTWAKRRAYAFEAFNYIKEHENDPSIQNWNYMLGYKFLPWNLALQNCVLLWRQVGNGVVPPDPDNPTTRGKKMPVWMMIRYRR